MNAQNDPGHGDSPAAWTAVTIMLLGFAIGTVAFFFAIVWLVWASVAIVLGGWAFGGIKAKAGYGVKGPKFTPKAHS